MSLFAKKAKIKFNDITMNNGSMTLLHHIQSPIYQSVSIMQQMNMQKTTPRN